MRFQGWRTISGLKALARAYTTLILGKYMKSQKKKKNSTLHSYQEMNQLSPPFKIKEVVIHEASHLVVSIALVAGS